MRASKPTTKSRGLHKSISTWRLAIYGVGTIIGAGIYSVIGPAAEVSGQAIWLSFLVAAAVSALSGLSYAELASSLPSASAEHNFLRQAFPKMPALAFLIGMFIAVHGAATLATVALTFGSYFRRFVDLEPTWVALGLIGLGTLVNISGLKQAAGLSAILTTIQVLCLLAFAALAFSSPQTALTPRADFGPVEWGAVVQGAAVLFFIYSGYEHMANLSEEARRPDRIWQAYLAALCITTAVYVLVIFGVLAVTDAETVATSSFPLAEAAGKIFSWLGPVIALAALLATANAVLSASVSGSRLLFGMAREGDLPGQLASVTKNQGAPWLAALILMLVAGVFALVGEIKFVASLSSLGITLVFAAVNLAVIVLRFRRPDLKRPFRVPSVRRLPMTASLGLLSCLALATRYELPVYLTFFGALALAAAPYVLRRKRRRLRGTTA